MGEVCMVPPKLECCVGQRQVLLRPNPKVVDGRYLLYALQSPQVQHEISWSEGTGSTVSNVRIPILEALRIPTPDLKTQREIGLLLGTLDARIDLLRQTNSTLESIAQALFKSWFIDFDPVRAKAKGREPEGMDAATAALFPAAFKESGTGLIPEGWTYRPAEELFEVGIGKTPPRKESHWFSDGSGDMRWLSIKDMGYEGAIASRSSEFLSNKAVAIFNVRVVPSRTVLMSFKLTVGRLSITDGPMCTNEAIAHFKAREGSPEFTYLYCYLKAFDFRTLGSTSSIADATNSKAVKGLPVLCPSRGLVDAFHRTSAVLFEKMFLQKSHWRRLEELRDTLLPRLISGKLRLPEAQEHLQDALA
jgi:type I restriction enzyme S subunit